MERARSRLSWPTLSALAGRLRPVTDLGARECGDASGSPPRLGFRLASNWRVRNSAGVSAVMGAQPVDHRQPEPGGLYPRDGHG
jgi:hypothetical protein